MGKYLSSVRILCVLLPLIGACGSPGEKESSVESAPAESPKEVLAGKPVFQSGDCKGEVGCIRGFISHGMRLTMTPKAGGIRTGANGNDLLPQAVAFFDAQDFGDRFDSAFIVPLLPEGKRDLYTAKMTPMVRRDNFAADFELYAEGDEANDDKVHMMGEGNFVLGDMKSYDSAMLRVVKTFRIEISKKPEAGDGSPEIKRSVTCLEVEAILPDIKIEAGKSFNVGGIRNFEFYYTENNSVCEERTKSDSQSRNHPATGLPPVGPSIP